MAGEMRHPLSGSIYGLDDDGLVRVEKNGEFGRFHWDGRWVEGPVRSADPQLCLWIGGPQLPPGMDMFSMLGGEAPSPQDESAGAIASTAGDGNGRAAT